MVIQYGSSFKPLGDRIIVKLSKRKLNGSGRLYIPNITEEKEQEGLVLAVGPGKISKKGIRLSMEVEVGNIVFFDTYAGAEYKSGGESYIILQEKDILFRR